jgi:hypothetical protein
MFVGLAVVTAFASGRGGAQLTTDAASSVAVFPLVVADGERDTVIQLVNDSPQRVFARCTYTPASAGTATDPIAFDIVLQARQPSHWVASHGRPADSTDAPCNFASTNCDGAGIDPGTIPALPAGFRGDLLCVQVDRSHAAMSGNALRGVATLVSAADGDVAKYPALGLAGLPVNDADNVLCLGGGVGDGCARGAEYAGCPQTWLLNQRPEGGAGAADAGALSRRSHLVIETCARRVDSGSATVQLLLVNEFEQRFSSALSVARWKDVALGDLTIFDRDVIGTDFLRTRLRSAEASGPGILVVYFSDQVTTDGAATGGAVAAVPYPEGVRAQQDRIVLSDE